MMYEIRYDGELVAVIFDIQMVAWFSYYALPYYSWRYEIVKVNQ